MAITQASEVYHYRSYLENLLTYGSDASASLLTKSFWYVDTGDILPCYPTAADIQTRDSSPVGVELSRVRKYSFTADYIVTSVTCRSI